MCFRTVGVDKVYLFPPQDRRKAKRSWYASGEHRCGLKARSPIPRAAAERARQRQHDGWETLSLKALVKRAFAKQRDRRVDAPAAKRRQEQQQTLLSPAKIEAGIYEE